MNSRSIQKIIDNDEELDIANLAKAHLEKSKREKKKNPIPGIQRSCAAWDKLKAKAIEEERWRQKLQKVWIKK